MTAYAPIIHCSLFIACLSDDVPFLEGLARRKPEIGDGSAHVVLEAVRCGHGLGLGKGDVARGAAANVKKSKRGGNFFFMALRVLIGSVGGRLRRGPPVRAVFAVLSGRHGRCGGARGRLSYGSPM